MGLSLLPEELLALVEQWPCRTAQINQLHALLSPTHPSPSTLVVYGPHATGKSSIISSYLQTTGSRHAIVECAECVTGRHLLERSVSAVYDALHEDPATATEDLGPSCRCESLSMLAVHLQRLLGSREIKFVLVFDGPDKQREAPATLLPALARMGELVRNPDVKTIGTPYIHFPAYTRQQTLHILALKPRDIFFTPPPAELNYDDETHEEDKKWLWPRFCSAVWDSVGESVARDLVSFQDACGKLWRPFVEPVVNGDFGTRDFSRLVVRQRKLFQDEAVLREDILFGSTATMSEERDGKGMVQNKSQKRRHDLPYYAKWLLIAAYLASFNPARLDALYFMKSTDRKKRRKGGGGGRPAQQRKLPRHLLAASPFALDRLLAILHAVLPHDFRSTIDVYKQVATLTRLRLLVRSGVLGSGDPLEAGAKWRIGTAMSWEYALELARGVGFDLTDYVAE